MNKKMSKRQKDLKSKLMAAICMLLVSSIMMVSTTYAWFTLSTAPEVTGITTAVGANGNLEMALLPSDILLENLNKTEAEGGIASAVGDSVAHTGNYKVSNVTWGNLVDLSNGYGLDKITLYPAALLKTGDKINVAAMLESPVYGADGRVEKLDPVTGFGVYTDNAFVESTGFGVRAIGKAANMSPRESSFRMARANINSYVSSAIRDISTALNKHGSVLADPVLSEAMDSPATYGPEQVAGLDGLVEGLEAALVNIEDAYLNAILAYAASEAGSEEAWTAVAAVVNTEGATLESVMAKMPSGLTVPGLSNYDDLVSTVEGLRAKVTDLEKEGDEAAIEAGFMEVAELLADPDAMEVGGYTKDEILADKKGKVTELLGLATSGKLVVTLASGGAFAEFADHLGKYTASVAIMDGAMNTTMEANTVVNAGKGHLPGAYAALAEIPPLTDTANTTKTLSDFYGYVIDMAFRTNAADSDLMLQIDPIDRIDGENTSENTLGGGSYMEFTSSSPNFTMEQMEKLMESIKIVFFNPADGTIINHAYLDNAKANGSNLRAEIHMEGASTNTSAAGFAHHTGSRYYGTVETAKVDGNENQTVYTYIYTSKDGASQLKEVVTKTVTPASGEGEEKVPEKTEWGTSTYYKYENGKFADTALDATTDADTIAALKVVKHSDGERITALTQNEAKAISVLVYLDGTSVTNADVAFDSTKSMTGTMNLQFSSSANLEPMKYGGALELPAETTPPASDGNDNTQSGGGSGGTTPTNLTNNPTVTGGTNVTATGSFDANKLVTINLTGIADTETVSAVSVGNNEVTDFTYEAGVLTFSYDEINAAAVVVITVEAISD